MATGKRGRPRAFDEDLALKNALNTFLHKGFHDATLDDLARGMGINKPSLYGAFGDKNALFHRVLRDYTTLIKSRIAEVFAAGSDLDDTINTLVEGAIRQFVPEKDDRMGCLVVNITSTAAGSDPELRAELATFIKETDALVEMLMAERFAQVLEQRGQTPRQLAVFVNNVAYALAFRARAGAGRKKLRQCAQLMLGVAGG